MSLSYLDYTKEDYKKNPENHHKEYWKKLFELNNIMDDNTIGIAAKYLDKCKKYLETHNVDEEIEHVLLPIVIKVISVDKKWPHTDFDPKHIFNVYNNIRVKVKQKFFNEIQIKKIDWEAQACLETAIHFSKNKNDKTWGLRP